MVLMFKGDEVLEEVFVCFEVFVFEVKCLFVVFVILLLYFGDVFEVILV